LGQGQEVMHLRVVPESWYPKEQVDLHSMPSRYLVGATQEETHSFSLAE
jgi:hypothetical protein